MKTPNLDKVLERQVGGTHYQTNEVQPAKFISAHELNFFCGCAIKYIFRYKNKGGITDLKKAVHYLEMQIALEQDKLITKKENLSEYVAPSRTLYEALCRALYEPR